MNIKISSLKLKTKKIRDFNMNEWKLVHPEHFGSQQDDKYWTKKKFFFKAEDKGKVVGTLDGNFMAGVMYISQLVIKKDKRGFGVGKELMNEAEKLARKNKLHKVYLYTGVDWKAVKFYEKLRYKTEVKLNNFYEHKDFWIMTKNIN